MTGYTKKDLKMKTWWKYIHEKQIFNAKKHVSIRRETTFTHRWQHSQWQGWEINLARGPLHFEKTAFSGGRIFQCRGSQPFCDHVSLQHSERWACTPSAFQHISMYTFRMLTDENVPLRFPMTKYIIMFIHRHI